MLNWKLHKNMVVLFLSVGFIWECFPKNYVLSIKSGFLALLLPLVVAKTSVPKQSLSEMEQQQRQVINSPFST